MVKNLDNIKEIQSILYDMLQSLTNFLTKNSIHYILCGGTLLGAIRHNGFIPWDDDIDILVDYENYIKLLDLLKTNNYISDDLFILKPGDDNHYFPFLKLYNKRYQIKNDRIKDCIVEYLSIDIFPGFHFSDNRLLHRIYLFKNRILKLILLTGYNNYQAISYNKIIYKVFQLIYKILGGYKNITKIMFNNAKSYHIKYNNSIHIGDATWPSGLKDYFTIDCVMPTVEHIFINHLFTVPMNYDLYLKHFYGDYMKIPNDVSTENHNTIIIK